MNGKNNRNESRLIFQTKLPSVKIWGLHSILIYDSILEKTECRSWIQSFKVRYKVKSGEVLKDINNFPGHIKKISALAAQIESRDLTFVVMGGGSVGDFGGFVASIFKRGVKLIMIPTTWLAAIDSAHGGKTALNISNIKNQIGTFYPADDIYLIKNILVTQPPLRAQESLGEVIKIGLIAGGLLWDKVSCMPVMSAEFYSKLLSKLLWRLLPELIEQKYKIVRRDPTEKKDIRHVLNLGHSFGHVFEVALNQPHGIAVMNGVALALNLSYQKGVLSLMNYNKILNRPIGKLFPKSEILQEMLRKSGNVRKILSQDKKMIEKDKIKFIFVKNPGNILVKKVDLDEILSSCLLL